MKATVSHPTRIALLVLFLGTAGLAKADVIERQVATDAGQTLYLEADIGSIAIEGGASNQVEIEVQREGQGSDKFEVNVDSVSDGVKIEGRWTGGDRGWMSGNNPKIKFRIKIPSQYNLDLMTRGGSIKIEDLQGTVKARTSGGSLSLGRIDGEVNARTSGGSIEIKGSSANIEARTSGGSISIGDVSGSVIAKTSGGSISVEEVHGSVSATTGGGSITARMASQPGGDSELSTSGGSVVFYVNPDLNLDIKARAQGGGVRSDIAIGGKTKDKRALAGSINDGGPEVRLSTSGGSVRIKSL